MNTHETHEMREPMPPMTCERMALILPLLDDGAIDLPSFAAAMEHLRTCAHCQRERERYAALDQALRDRFGFSSAPRHTTEEVMQHITERDQPSEHNPHDMPTPANPRRFTPFSRPWLSGLGAVAVVVVLLGMAVLLFGGRLGIGPGAHGGPPRYTFTGTQGLFVDVSMVSPTEGWALAQVTKTSDGKSTPNTVTFYHYLNGTWTPVTLTLSAQAADTLRTGGPGAFNGFNGMIRMDSATDGWALARNYNRASVLFHYSSGKWQEVNAGAHDLADIQAISAHSVWTFSDPDSAPFNAIFHFDGVDTWTQQTINGISPQSRIVALQMASDSQGWALIYQNGGHYKIAQYAGHNTWNVHSSLDAGGLGDITDLAMVSSDDGWAIGQRGLDGPDKVTAGKPVPQTLYHYTHGKWQSVPLTFTSAGAFVTLERIMMRSAHDGWIIGQEQNQRPGITASGIQRSTILFHYDGNTWTQVRAPEVGGDASAITGMSFVGDAGWACGYVAALPDGKTIQDSDVPSYGSPMLWRYSDGGWVLYQQK